jgi:hypothetical protein
VRHLWSQLLCTHGKHHLQARVIIKPSAIHREPSTRVPTTPTLSSLTIFSRPRGTWNGGMPL